MKFARVTSVAAGLLVVVSAAACTSHHSSTSKTTTPSSASASKKSTQVTLPQAKVPASVLNKPATRKYVTLTSCGATKGGWSAAGTAKNPKKTAADYKITVFFTTTQATVLNYAVTTVHVPAGKSAQWKAARSFPAAKSMNCVLRGVG